MFVKFCNTTKCDMFEGFWQEQQGSRKKHLVYTGYIWLVVLPQKIDYSKHLLTLGVFSFREHAVLLFVFENGSDISKEFFNVSFLFRNNRFFYCSQNRSNETNNFEIFTCKLNSRTCFVGVINQIVAVLWLEKWSLLIEFSSPIDLWNFTQTGIHCV